MAKGRRTVGRDTIIAQGSPSSAVYFETLTPRQRDHFARWVVERLSNSMARDEIIAVLKTARKHALAVCSKEPDGATVVGVRKRGRPPIWVGAFGAQMLMEVETLLEANPGMKKQQAIAQCVQELWTQRFGENIDFERRYYDAEKYFKGR